jgi:hypothetical protein
MGPLFVGLLVAGILLICLSIAGMVCLLVILTTVHPPMPPPPLDDVVITSDYACLRIDVEPDFYGKPVFEFYDHKLVGQEAFVTALREHTRENRKCLVERELSFFVQGLENTLSDQRLKALVKKAGVTWVNVNDGDSITRVWGLPPELRKQLLAKGQPLEVTIIVVGVLKGDYQFRLNGELVEGRDALAGKLRKAAAVVARKRGGPVLISPDFAWARELNDVAADRGDRLRRSLWSSVPEIAVLFGYRGSGGIKRHPGEKLLVVTVTMMGSGKDGMTYRVGKETACGDKALSVALKTKFTNWRKGQAASAMCRMHVKLTVAPDAETATEEQISNARKAVKSSGARVYEPDVQETAPESTLFRGNHTRQAGSSERFARV